MDTMEKQMLEGNAAVMAEELLKRPGVRAVQLIDIPHHTDGPPYYVGAEYRLLVIVDDELAEQYKQRLLNPASIPYQDGDDKDATWWDERAETSQEAVFHLLGTTEESFYENLDGGGHDISFHDVRVEELIDIILLPENWTTQAGTMLERFHTDLDGNAYMPLLPEGEGHYALNNYRVFDPITRTFVSPS